MSKNHSFFGNAFFYTLGVVLAQGTNYITMMILGRLMTTDQFGYLSVYVVWVNIFSMIAGLQAYGSMNNAKLDLGADKLDAYTSSTYGLGLVSMAAMVGIFFLLQDFLVSSMQFSFNLILLFLIQGFFSFTIQHLASKYRVLNQPGKFVFWTAAIWIIRLVVSILLVLQLAENKYLGDVYGSTIAYTVVGVAAVFVIFIRGKSFYNAKWWKYCLAISLPYVFSGLANYVLMQSNRLMLQYMSTPEETGLYGYVATTAIAITGVWIAFNNAWSVWYFDKTHAGEKEQIVHLYKKYCMFVTLLSVAFTLVCPDIVRILGGQQYSAGVNMVPLIAAGAYFLFLYSFPMAYEAYKQKTAYIAICTVAAAVLNIVINLFVIPLYGGMGAAAATLVSYAALFIFHFIIARFVIKGFEIPFVQLLIPALYVLASVVVTYLFMDAWPVRWILGFAMLGLSFRTYLQSRHIMME